MRIGVIGDLHAHSGRIETRTDDSGEVVLEKLSRVLEMFKNAGISNIICTGDFCHSSIQSKAYQARLVSILAFYAGCGLQVYSLVGNHIGDQREKDWTTYKEKDLGILASAGLIKVCKSYPVGDMTVSFIHAYRYDFAGKYIDGEAERNAEIVVAHYFLNTGFDDLIIKYDDLKKIYPKMRWLVLGHDHSTFQPAEHNGVHLVAPGSLLRTSFRERDRDVYVAVIDTMEWGTDRCVKLIPVSAAKGDQIFQTEVRETEKEAEEQLQKFMASLEDIKLRQGEMIDFINLYLEKIPDSKVRDKFKALLTQAGVI